MSFGCPLLNPPLWRKRSIRAIRLLLLAFGSTGLLAPLPLGAAPVDFGRDIAPLLEEHCLKCHGAEKQKGGLRLDHKTEASKGGDSGDPLLVPHEAGRSLLFRLVSSQDDDERMPPPKDGVDPLNADQLELLKQWIDSGAAWPDDGDGSTPPTRSEMVVTDEDRRHWSFLPVAEFAPPEVTGPRRTRTPVDSFIGHAQEAKRLSPAAPAEPRTLVRRIYFDLIGLPPTPEELASWIGRIEKSDKAIAELVDDLLKSPHYGERWARHWLDVARYADSNGMEGDHDRPNAWRYRDFVIRALNDDLPFDTFVRWQLAGDEFEPDNPQAIAATGFIVAGVNEILPDEQMPEEKLRGRANELDDMVSTTAQAMLGLTLACARCHDHKYDPLPTRDYYRMMRIFNSGDRTDVPWANRAEVQAHDKNIAKWQPGYNAAVKERDSWLAKARDPISEQVRRAKINKLPISGKEKQLLSAKPNDAGSKKLAERFKKQLKVEDADYVAALPKEQKVRWNELDGRVKSIAARKPNDLPQAFAFADFAPEPPDSWFFERGDFMARNEKMDLGFLTVLMDGKTAEDYWSAAKKNKLRDDSSQQRRALANWMTDLEHGSGALLARVMVNRVWQHHFGEGLVRTVSDFGTRGELPTHPELLDWLTGEFIRSGWSVKHLHRLIVNSATYQQSSAFDESKAAIDPENRLLWRRRPLRLESEIFRDSMLAVAGTLNPEVYGPGFKPPIPAEAMQARNSKSPYPLDAKDTPETRRRSLYLFHKRVVQYPLMQAFDAPDAQVSCAQRMNTTVAPQALAMLNDPFVRLRATELAERLFSQAGDDPAACIALAFRLCLSRDPLAEEIADATAFIADRAASRVKRDPKLSPTAARQLGLTDFCQSLFGLNEFIYID